mgnify:CR=1 FL=1
MKDIKQGTIRVFWSSHVPPGEFEYYYVKDMHEAKLVLSVLSRHDLNLGDNIITSNIGGLEIFNDGEWEEWLDDNYDNLNFDDVFKSLSEPK